MTNKGQFYGLIIAAYLILREISSVSGIFQVSSDIYLLNLF